MKTKLLISIITILCHYGYTQNLSIREKTSSDGVKYTISELGAGGKRGSTVRNNKNKLFKENDLSPSEMGNSYYSYINFNETASANAHNLIVKAFKDKRKQVPRENIQSRFYINPNGKILEIDFLLRKGSDLSIDDLNLVEKTLINKFTFHTDPKMLKGIPVIKFFWPLMLGGTN